ncbi:hypothetical protein RJ55_05289 [Drechmeria coniospora]|nr:hypothetical protein RJ55_05289 [Drechmeria coniospora]
MQAIRSSGSCNTVHLHLGSIQNNFSDLGHLLSGRVSEGSKPMVLKKTEEVVDILQDLSPRLTPAVCNMAQEPAAAKYPAATPATAPYSTALYSSAMYAA